MITPEDIRQSGATNIPDLLRMVPGMDVAQINSNTWAISARGFNFQFASKLLVLIDGRAVYSPLFGGVNWDTQDVPLEDIGRIEVIRGPGGAVWGANAVNGVINIITKKAEETPGVLMTGGGVSAYLLKPIRQSELREAVARVLGARKQRGATPLITRFSLHDAREPAASLRVLLVEDNAVNQRLASRLLEKRGHSVEVAGNGLEALEALEKESFDLVLMDVQMPVMDGFEATAAIRKKEGGSGIRVPIVALTAHAMKGDREKCLAGGMDRYLTKPIRPQELDELLENYLVRRVETTEAQESTLSKK